MVWTVIEGNFWFIMRNRYIWHYLAHHVTVHPVLSKYLQRIVNMYLPVLPLHVIYVSTL